MLLRRVTSLIKQMNVFPASFFFMECMRKTEKLQIAVKFTKENEPRLNHIFGIKSVTAVQVSTAVYVSVSAR